MCPDKETLSAFIDNEVEGKFRINIEEHLSKCGKCSSEISKMSGISAYLKENSTVTQEMIENSGTKVWYSLQLIDNNQAERDFWHRSVKVPVPLLAAAAAVFILFAVSTILGLFVLSDNGGEHHFKYSESLTIDKIEDFNIFERDQVLEVDLQLPENTIFMISGTPRLIREVDYINTGK